MNLTLDAIKRSMRDLESSLSLEPHFGTMIAGPQAFAALDSAKRADRTDISMLCGMKVVRSPIETRPPKMQLKPTFAAMMPPDWVAETNAWMADFFGYEEVVYLINDDFLRNGMLGALRF